MSIFNTLLGIGKIASGLFGGKDKNETNTNTKTNTNTDLTSFVESAGFDSLEEFMKSLQTVNQDSTSTEDSRVTDTTTLNTDETSTSNQNMTGGTTSTGSEQQSQTSLGFSEELMGELNALLGATIQGGGGITAGQQALQNRLNAVQGNGFDVDDFVSGVMKSATQTAKGALESGINGIESSIGGSTSGNSMAALLANRMRNEAASNLAGIESQARATGAGIRAQESTELTNLAQAGGQGTLQLIQALMGAQSTMTGNVQTDMAEQTQQNQTGNTNTSSNQVSAGQRDTTTTGSQASTTETASQQETVSNQIGVKETETEQNEKTQQNTSQNQKSNKKGSMLDDIFQMFADSSANA